MEVDNNDLLPEVNGIKLPSMVEENIDSSCTVDNESNSPHAITDHLSDGVTLAVADSTTPEVDRDFENVQVQPKCMILLFTVFMKVKSTLKRRGTQSEKRKLKHKKLTPTRQRTSNSKFKRTPIRRARLSLQHSLTSSF